MTVNDDGVLPFVLPRSTPVRSTYAGWQQFRATRNDFVPAPVLDLKTWQLLSPRKKALHDLHRAATNANMPLLETPMTQAVTKLVRGRVQTNALKFKPSTRAGVMVSGGGYQGKTETICAVLATFEDDWRALHRELNPDALPGTRDLHAPVAYVQTPVTATPKSACKAILGFFGTPFTDRMSLPDLIVQVRDSITSHGTKALVLDFTDRG